MTRVTIPADHWHANNDGTAWLIAQRCRDDRAPQEAHWGVGHPCVYGCRALDRPCGTCDGRGIAAVTSRGEDGYDACPDCIDGRHTFEVEIDRSSTLINFPPGTTMTQTLRVSIVPGMVLPIVELVTGGECPDSPHVCLPFDQWCFYDGDVSEEDIALPPAAKPGMWAVKLAVQS